MFWCDRSSPAISIESNQLCRGLSHCQHPRALCVSSSSNREHRAIPPHPRSLSVPLSPEISIPALCPTASTNQVLTLWAEEPLWPSPPASNRQEAHCPPPMVAEAPPVAEALSLWHQELLSLRQCYPSPIPQTLERLTASIVIERDWIMVSESWSYFLFRTLRRRHAAKFTMCSGQF